MLAYKPSGILAASKEEIVAMVNHDIDELAPICEAALAKAEVHLAVDWDQMTIHLKTVAVFFKTTKWSDAFKASQERLQKAEQELKEAPKLLRVMGLLPEQFAIDAWNCSNVLSLGLVSHGHKVSVTYILKEWTDTLDEQMRLFNEVKKTAQVANALE